MTRALQKGSPWTPERIARLQAMAAEGRSCSYMAAELGCGLTRNAIIGKLHRLGIKGNRQTPRAPYNTRGSKRRKPAKRTTVVRQLFAYAGAEKLYVRRQKPDPLPDASIPEAQRLTLLQLRDGVCRWPCGDPGDASFFFCGGPTYGDLPYCAAHCRAAYETPAAGRARRPARITQVSVIGFRKAG